MNPPRTVRTQSGMRDCLNDADGLYVKVRSGTGELWWIPLPYEVATDMVDHPAEWMAQYSDQTGNMAFEPTGGG